VKAKQKIKKEKENIYLLETKFSFESLKKNKGKSMLHVKHGTIMASIIVHY